MLKLLRSGDEGALLQAYEEDQRYLQHTRRISIPALSWENTRNFDYYCQGDKPAMGLWRNKPRPHTG